MYNYKIYDPYLRSYLNQRLSNNIAEPFSFPARRRARQESVTLRDMTFTLSWFWILFPARAHSPASLYPSASTLRHRICKPAPFTPLCHSAPLKAQQSGWVWRDVLPAIHGYPSIVLDELIDKWLLLRTKISTQACIRNMAEMQTCPLLHRRSLR